MKNVLLTLLAYLLLAFFTPFGIVFTILFMPLRISDYFRRFSLALDQLGNVTCSYLLDKLMIKGLGYPFGNEDQTISYVLAVNKQSGTLTWLGRWLCNLLDNIEADHINNSIKQEQEK